MDVADEGAAVTHRALPRIVVVGLGPGDDTFVTEQTRQAIASHEHRFLRTARHPSASLVTDAVSFDDLYEHADTFDSVYDEIAERLVAAAAEHGVVLYAVPGSPLMLERSVRTLRDDARVALEILPAMSFLDLVWPALGVDPIEAGVTLIDGHEFARAAVGVTGPMLIAHCHANWVLSEIKLAIDDAGEVSNDDCPVVVLHRLGTSDAAVVHTTWGAMDSAVDADHLTTVYVPQLRVGAAEHYVRFHALARTLREQCPWDIEQTHSSLIPYLLEETYEVVDALQALDGDDESTDAAVIEELGDLLYQIEFHAVIAEQQGRFSMADITQGIHDKLVRRHPHVFADVDATTTDTVLANWDEIKRVEKQRTSVFDGVPMSMPSLSYADAVQRKAAKVGFDWPDAADAAPKVAEEADELMQAAASGDADAAQEELGDLLFSVVNVARKLKLDPEVALRAAVTKFRRRFTGVEALASARGIDLRASDLAALDQLWDEVKSNESTARSADDHSPC